MKFTFDFQKSGITEEVEITVLLLYSLCQIFTCPTMNFYWTKLELVKWVTMQAFYNKYVVPSLEWTAFFLSSQEADGGRMQEVAQWVTTGSDVFQTHLPVW